MSEPTKVAIVTGASRGIGHAIVSKLAADGLAVVVNYMNSAAEAEKLVKDIAAKGGKAIAVRANVAINAECVALFDAATKAFGGVDVLVNNAGVMALKPIAEVDDAMFARIMDINLKGVFQMLRLGAKQVRDGGRIINISTSATPLALPNYGVYCASKAAVEAFSMILARELRGRNITVNAVAPGPTATELFFEGKDEAFVERLKQMSPLGRLGETVDIAEVVAFIASAKGGWINGQVVRTNGGTV